MKKPLPFLFILSAFILALMFCTSCKSDPKHENAEKAVEIGKVNFYIETSASMGGYFRGSTDFTSFLSNFLVDVDNKLANNKLQINFIANTITPFDGDKIKFIETYSTQNISRSKSSPLDSILIKIAEDTKANDISIFISDGIMSGSDEEIKMSPNRNFNFEKATSVLKPKIKNAFYKLKDKSFGVSVYGKYSTFNGKYYNYKNDTIRINGTKARPYYIWVIANKKILKDFDDKLKKELEFKPELSLHYGYDFKTVTDFHVLHENYKEGDCSFDGNKVTDISIPKRAGELNPTFAVVIDLSNLPTDAQDINLLKHVISNNLQSSYCNVRLKDVKMEEITRSQTNDDYKGLPEKSHVLIFEVLNMTNDNASVSIQMPLTYDDKYRQWSTMDDLIINNLDSTTFAFEHLIDGIKDAYSSNSNYYINFKIDLNR